MVLDRAATDLSKLLPALDARTAKIAQRVQQAMRNQSIGPHHFAGSTGYGHGDLGREAFDAVIAEIMGTEACMARIQFITPGHALAVALLGNLRAGDHVLVASGTASADVEALLSEGPGTLQDWGIASSRAALSAQGELDLAALRESVQLHKPAVVLIQRGPSITAADAGTAAMTRRTVTTADIRATVSAVKAEHPQALVVVDNRGAELLEADEPGHAGADIVTGSLLGNLGGSVATEGGYVAGRQVLVERACARLSAPGLSLDAGSVPGDTLRLLFQGLFLAPGMVGESLKGTALAAGILADLGYSSSGVADTGESAVALSSVLATVDMGSEAAAFTLLQAVQQGSCLSASSACQREKLPSGDVVVLAGGQFVQGSTSGVGAMCRLRPPYSVHLYGGTHWAQWASIMAFALPKLMEHSVSS